MAKVSEAEVVPTAPPELLVGMLWKGSAEASGTLLPAALLPGAGAGTLLAGGLLETADFDGVDAVGTAPNVTEVVAVKVLTGVLDEG